MATCAVDCEPALSPELAGGADVASYLSPEVPSDTARGTSTSKMAKL